MRMGFGGRACVQVLRLGCGLLVAYGCGRTAASAPDDASGASGGSNESGGAQAHGGSKPSGGASSTGGSSSSGNGGAMPASGGSLTSGGAFSATGGVDGGADDAGSAGSAGSAGVGGDSGVCGINVPATNATGGLQAAIDAAPVPSTICLGPGGFRGDLTLRAGVSLRGLGVGSVICGTVNGDAATSRRTTLSDLQIEGAFEATGNVQLSLRDLEINTYHTAICSPGSSVGVRIAQTGGGALDLAIDGVTLGSPGIEIALRPGGERIDDSIVIRNSRCDSTSQCYDFLRFTFDTQPAAQAGVGSRLMLDIFNNVIRNVVLEGVVFDVKGSLSAEDAAQSRLWFRHNTLASAGDSNSAIAFYAPPSLPVVVANNAIAYIATPVLHGDAPAVTQVGNLVSADESSTSWFADFASGDFSPSLNSPLIGKGSSVYGVPTDIDGTTRVGGFDSGAYQH